MTQSASRAIPVARVLETVMRTNRGRLLAALAYRTGDVQRAEDALQEAMASALTHWGRAGVPDSPEGWLLRAALRKTIDGYRRDKTAQGHAAEMERLAEEEAVLAEAPEIPDDRLRLIFACCHPALEEKSRVALTLRTLCGLPTPRVAAVFLDAEATMGQRLSRAKAKILATRIPFAVPGPEDWPERLNSVLTVVYLIFTAGYAQGPETELSTEAIFLARLLVTLAPDEAEVEGCLALLLITQSRAAARISPEGQTLPPTQQDRTLWNAGMLAEGLAILDRAVARRTPGPFQIKAAIAALNTAADGPDWPQIAALYARLHDFEPTPVIRLNHAVALAEAGHPDLALQHLDAIADDLAEYQPFHAAKAELLARTGRTPEALAAYDTAIALAASAADRAFLTARRAALR
ncbi:RNA polymerase sigma factor [Tabrizicola sp.]|uniref:RNA polymerase sigma factor n=1 Tax=Tabrizicola sp. TaxID=2005166 RepID=UPI003F2C6644